MPYIIKTGMSYCPKCDAEGSEQSCQERGELIDDHDDRGLRIDSRLAVATLEEVFTDIHSALGDIGDPDWHDIANDEITKAGGTIGPMPDGTVIEVQPFDTAAWYSNQALFGPLPAMSDADIIDAYNAAQETSKQ